MKILAILILAATANAGVLPNANEFKMDWALYEQWQNSIKHQRFPQLPKPSGLDMNIPEDPRKRPRYIMQMNTKALGKKIKDGNQWYMAYQLKGYGTYILMVNPGLLRCLEKATKKFDRMQWVVFPHEVLGEHKVIVLETPRQCVGNFKTTGGKLKNPIEKK